MRSPFINALVRGVIEDKFLIIQKCVTQICIIENLFLFLYS